MTNVRLPPTATIGAPDLKSNPVTGNAFFRHAAPTNERVRSLVFIAAS